MRLVSADRSCLWDVNTLLDPTAVNSTLFLSLKSSLLAAWDLTFQHHRNGPPNIEGMVTLKVDNVPYNSSIDELRRVFEK